MPVIAPILIFAVLAAPAVRLLLLAARTRQAPELWVGFYFLGCAIGLPLRVVGHALDPTNPALASDVNAVGHAFFAAATCALTLFTWRVFRPKARWAAMLAPVLIVSIAGTTVWILRLGVAGDESSHWVLMANAGRLGPLFWASIESIRYWRVMRRRGALGLADPIVTNRFLLWSLWTGAMSALPAMTLALRVLFRIGEWIGVSLGDDFAQAPGVVLAVRIVFFLSAPVGAVALSLSFFPPDRYLQRVRSRAEARNEVPRGTAHLRGAA